MDEEHHEEVQGHISSQLVQMPSAIHLGRKGCGASLRRQGREDTVADRTQPRPFVTEHCHNRLDAIEVANIAGATTVAVAPSCAS